MWPKRLETRKSACLPLILLLKGIGRDIMIQRKWERVDLRQQGCVGLDEAEDDMQTIKEDDQVACQCHGLGQYR